MPLLNADGLENPEEMIFKPSSTNNILVLQNLSYKDLSACRTVDLLHLHMSRYTDFVSLHYPLTKVS